MGQYLFLFYGGLAALAFWATYRDRDLLWVGVWLIAGWAISNLLDWYTPIFWRPGPYSLIELMLVYAVSIAWAMDKRRWPLLLFAAAAIVSIIATIAFALNYPPDRHQIYVWKLTTNLCFAAECLLATVTGVIDGYRTGRFHRVPRILGRAVAAYAARKRAGP